MKNLSWKFPLQSALVCVSLISLASQAATVTFNFDSGSSGLGLGGDGFGNSIQFSNSGLTVNVTGYGMTDNQGSLFFPDWRLDEAEVSQWQYGIGVCNQSEGSIDNNQCDTSFWNDEHQVDSAGKDDFIVLTFDQTVSMTSAVIDPYQIHDRDVSYWIGSVAEGFSLAGARESDITGLIGGSQIDTTASTSAAPLTLDLNAASGNILILKPGDNNWFDLEDYFKLSSITVETTEIPLPASLWLFASALLGLAHTNRQKRL